MILRHRTGPAFQAIKDGLAVRLNALTLTDITKNATYGVEIESLVLEINTPASS
ncbi:MULTISPECIES: hypothetical protein [Enterobacteriaceae]|uniref:hypothetical protein n=1 Tax=Enterobacteriaceae TaxID=543 RepID=UPI000937B9E7|nr:MULTISPECIES: hypothetical protein [Enterobacteriaceae]AVU65508.1 hypothetical protein A9X72_09740 [Escherichia coli]EEZ7477219.1 hypothetical protein [Escherichia coli]EEZ7569765.1 hypothetical protein [Escherichia coli]EFG2992529.1 hypothetical protein [Escherichia coli]EFG8189416.1 hypothetical protein [Escherichia coli]